MGLLQQTFQHAFGRRQLALLPFQLRDTFLQLLIPDSSNRPRFCFGAGLLLMPYLTDPPDPSEKYLSPDSGRLDLK
jgi:hypothetical protein